MIGGKPLEHITTEDYEWERGRRATYWDMVCPPRFHGKVENSPQPIEAQAWVCDLIGGKPRAGVLILGPVGTGKTHLALGMAHDIVIHLGVGVVFAPVVTLLDRLRPGHSEDDGMDWMSHYVKAPLLILDDLGGEKPSDWTAERLYSLVNLRWLAQRPTIATSNLSPDDLKAAIGERTYDRLRHDALGIQLGGESRRVPL